MTLLSSGLASCLGQAFSCGNTQHPTGKRVCLSHHSCRVESHWPAGSLPILETGKWGWADSPEESPGTLSGRRMDVGQSKPQMSTQMCVPSHMELLISSVLICQVIFGSTYCSHCLKRLSLVWPAHMQPYLSSLCWLGSTPTSVLAWLWIPHSDMTQGVACLPHWTVSSLEANSRPSVWPIVGILNNLVASVHI